MKAPELPEKASPVEKPALSFQNEPGVRRAPTPAPVAPTAVAPVPKEEKEEPEKKPEQETKKADEAPAVPDWGFLKKKPRGRIKLKIAAAAGLIILSAGGYGAYLWMHGSSASTEAETGASEETDSGNSFAEASDSAASSPGQADPFDDPPRRIASQERRLSLDEPRRVRNSSDALPIRDGSGGSTRPTSATGRNPLADDSSELPVDLDSTPDQSEPDLGDEEDLGGPELASPSSRSGKAGSKSPRLIPDRPSRPIAARSAQTARTLDETEGDLSGDPLQESAKEQPNVGRGTPAKERIPPKARPGSAGPAISIVDARDDADSIDNAIDSEEENREALDGFVEKDANSRRAASRTVVIRPENAGAHSADATGAARNGESPSGRRLASTRGGIDSDASMGSELKFEDDGFVPAASRAAPINARRSNPPPAAIDPRTGNSYTKGFATSTTAPATDSYRVAPDDNFWKISRKQYGTARYFQALAKHNEARVSDPTRLRPGMTISTPPAAVLEQRYPELIERSSNFRGPIAAPGEDDAPGFERPISDRDLSGDEIGEGKPVPSGYFYGKNGAPMYRIGSDDTLTGIAQRCLGRASRWSEIYEQNRDVLDSPDDLRLGTVIRLPSDASRVGLVPDAPRRR